MPWTKRQLIGEAFGEIALAGYEFDITPEEHATALRRLDTMMATWEARGIRVGYAFPSGPAASDPDDDSGLPDAATEAAFMGLAVRLAPSFGKVLSVETRRTAREGFEMLLLDAARPQQQQLPSTLPRGAGNKGWQSLDRPFFPQPSDDPLGISQGGDLAFRPE